MDGWIQSSGKSMMKKKDLPERKNPAAAAARR